MNLVLAASLSDRMLNGFCDWLVVVAIVIIVLRVVTPPLSRMAKETWMSIRPDESKKKKK